jgi:hypothetical protein
MAAALLMAGAVVAGGAPNSARADIVVISGSGHHVVQSHRVVESPRLEADLTRLRALHRPIRRFALVDRAAFAPCVTAASDRGGVLRARTLAHARLLARRR